MNINVLIEGQWISIAFNYSVTAIAKYTHNAHTHNNTITFCINTKTAPHHKICSEELFYYTKVSPQSLYPFGKQLRLSAEFRWGRFPSASLLI